MLVNQNVMTVMFIVTLTYFDSLCLGYHLLRTTRQTNCRSIQFTCKSGDECVFFNKVCDGRHDCTDGSDESHECKDVPCPDNTFRCSYGACVDGNFKCNGQQECADGSDEDAVICGSGLTTSLLVSHAPLTNDVCPAVNINNGQTKLLGGGYVPGSPIPNYSLVKLTCNTNYSLYPNNPLIHCIDGKWHVPIPQCKPTCSPRNSSSVDITCTVDSETVDCSQPMVDGTVAVGKCKHFYVQVENLIPISRCSGGSWDNPLIRCEPECGEVIPKGATNVIAVNAQNAKRGEFPWHVAIYRKKTEKYEYQCGGSIITPLIILTAAHCFTDELGTERYPAEEYYVAAGKYYSDYNAADDKFAQKSQLKEYHIPSGYRGYQSNFAGDLALGVLKKPFQMTNVVQPVCVDWDNALESQQLKSNNRGTVVGWGYVDPNKQQASEELKLLNAPFIDVGDCLDAVPANFRRWVTPDKFCAGFTNGSSVCKGDSGGGIVFKRTETSRQKHYIRGLVSTGPVQQGVCDNFQYGVYTRISFYKDFMLNIVAANQIL